MTETTSAVILVVLFIAATLSGYKILTNIPSLLHTPLMSGMNALSGVTVLGAIVVTALAVITGSVWMGAIAIVLATTNTVGGFYVTHRMLKMFRTRG